MGSDAGGAGGAGGGAGGGAAYCGGSDGALHGGGAALGAVVGAGVHASWGGATKGCGAGWAGTVAAGGPPGTHASGPLWAGWSCHHASCIGPRANSSAASLSRRLRSRRDSLRGCSIGGDAVTTTGGAAPQAGGADGGCPTDDTAGAGACGGGAATGAMGAPTTAPTEASPPGGTPWPRKQRPSGPKGTFIPQYSQYCSIVSFSRTGTAPVFVNRRRGGAS